MAHNKLHASEHTDGTDNIQSATNAQKGLATAAQITKLDGIEALADVTDSTNVKAALDGAVLTTVAVAGTDKVIIQDTSDSDNIKTVTAQEIADLGGGGGTVQGVVGTYDIQPTDEGATAGNARGENSVDLCTERSNAAYVCAGINSGALAGEDNGGTGTHSFYGAGRDNHNNIGDYCSIFGYRNQGNRGDSCLIAGEGGGVVKIATSGTSISSSTGLVTSVAHGLTNGMPLIFTELVGGFILSTSTIYYVRDALTDTFAISQTLGGSAIPVFFDYTVANYVANAVNYGDANAIVGYGNGQNIGNYCSISGRFNSGNSGDGCLIAGQGNDGNSGDNCSISGSYNDDNTGNNCLIAGFLNYDNSGDYCSISGHDNHSNSGNYTRIDGWQNYSNSGSNCSISGKNNYSNSGSHCNISGLINHTNTGNYCNISGAGNNSNSGTYCSISGATNYSNSGTHCSIAGRNNHSNTGHYSSITGYSNYDNSGSYCSISGFYATGNALDYARVHGGGQSARIIDLVAASTTTNATPKAITFDGGPEGASASIVIPINTTWGFTISVVARRTDVAGTQAFYKFEGCIENEAGTVAIVGTVIKTVVAEDDTDLDCDVSADATYEALRILATGIAAQDFRWTARIDITQVD